MNSNVDEVVVKANTVFADVEYTSEDFVKFSTMVVQLGTMRSEDLFLLQKKNNLTSAETFEDWTQQLEKASNEEKTN